MHASPHFARVRSITVHPYSYRMRRVVRTAAGVFVQRDGWHIVVRSTDGYAGAGDVAPWPGFGSDAATCAQALQRLPEAWAHRAWPTSEVYDIDLAALPVEVAFGLSCALLDIEAQRANVGLSAHLAAHQAPALKAPVHALVDNALEAQAAIAQGFKAIKVKVGIEAVSDEVTRIVGLRAAIGPDIGLRLDANGAWPVPVALRAARLLALVSPEWLEQPVDRRDVAGLAEVRRLGGVRIAADESVMGAQDLDAIISHNAADVIVVKPMFAGGVRQAVRLGEAARAAGLEVIVTHALESAVGRLGALHVALALGCQSPCGLGGALPEGQLQAPAVSGGQMQPFAAPGLGLTPGERDGLVC